MAPQQHLQWFEDNIDWFERLRAADLDEGVPSCPGWTVAEVVNHLSFGLGLGYQAAVSTPPDTPDREVFVDVAWPEVEPVGSAVLEVFSQHMRSCLATFATTDPDRPTWTYGGPGQARFWFRRAAIETTLHRMDVADALSTVPAPLPAERAADAIAETLEFALPLAARIAGEPAGRLTVAVPDLRLELGVGRGEPGATIIGGGDDVLAALWGRHPQRVTVDGDGAVATSWLSRIEHAFAGR